MSGLLNCGICCMIFSVWGILQLVFMGLFFYIESIVLLEDVEAEEYDDYDDFIKKTKSNYAAAALNCWIAAGIYLVSLGLSYTCIIKAKSKAKAEALKLEDDEYVCTPRVHVKKSKKSKKNK